MGNVIKLRYLLSFRREEARVSDCGDTIEGTSPGFVSPQILNIMTLPELD